MTNDHGPREACGVFGVFGHDDAAKLTYFGLYALQHRGQESAGIVTSTGRSMSWNRVFPSAAAIWNSDGSHLLCGGVFDFTSEGDVCGLASGAGFFRRLRRW